MRLKSRRFVSIAVGLASLCMTPAVPERAAARELLLAEPVHHVGFLPIYVARHKGYFKDEGIDIKLAVLAAGGFVNAVLSGDAFAYIASVDHNAFARAKGMSLIAVSNLLGRTNIMMACTDIPPLTGDLPSYLKGKRIAVGAYGGTPNKVLRYAGARKARVCCSEPLADGVRHVARRGIRDRSVYPAGPSINRAFTSAALARATLGQAWPRPW